MPKPPPKRDFIRENKQKLRAVQRFSCPRRENSEQDEFSTRRSHVRQPQAPVRSRSIPAHRIPSGCSCASKQTESSMASVQPPSRRRSVNCDKSIQTDDIDDEAFLADALRRCSTRNQRDHGDLGNGNFISDTIDDIPHLERMTLSYENNLNVDLSQINDDNHLSETQEPILRKSHSRHDLDEKLLDDGNNNKGQQRISNRSDLRSRREIRIPKYLEREKREKELQRIREMEKDPNCPAGHYVLSEDDRKAALTAAENKFRQLVNELNRMPMSGETLRIRNRKMEIEKALIDLENTIRNFSKSKVYVKDEK